MTSNCTGASYYSGAGIGSGCYGDSELIVIEGNASVVVVGGTGGAGIGGGREGNSESIIIKDNVNVQVTGGRSGAGIGSGDGGNSGTIEIRGKAVVNATAGDYGAGIGGGSYGNSESITINDNVTIQAVGRSEGTGIGSGRYGNSGIIEINDKAVVNTTTGNYGAAIGGGNGGDSGIITINGETEVTAVAGSYGVGVGAGAACGTITISEKAKVTAESGQYGTGIGTRTGGVTRITITGQTEVYAEAGIEGGQYSGPAIGGGVNTGFITIGGTADVTAITRGSRNTGAGIGAGTGDVGEILLKDQANVEVEMNCNAQQYSSGYGSYGSGAGIGSGRDAESTGNIIIQDEVQVSVSGKMTGAGIGTGAQGKKGNIIITDRAVIDIVQEGYNGAGIGGGGRGAVDTISITDEVDITIQMNGFYSGAGIGTGLTTAAYPASIDSIEISGGASVAVTSSNSHSAGIGTSSYGNVEKIKIAENTVVKSTGVCGIGTGNSGNVDLIQISGGAEVEASGRGTGAGIGSSSGGYVADICIEGNPVVSATGGDGSRSAGCGIGNSNRSGAAGEITITGGEVYARGGSFLTSYSNVYGAPGIGSLTTASPSSEITITGGTVYAYGGATLSSSRQKSGAGIGGGYGAGSADIEITTDAVVYAYSYGTGKLALDARSGSMSGGAWFVNAYLTTGPLDGGYDAEIHAYEAGHGNENGYQVDARTLPADYVGIAYMVDVTNETEYELYGYSDYQDWEDKIKIVRVDNESLPVIAHDDGTYYQVKTTLPASGDLSHSDVTQHSATLISSGHALNGTTYLEGRFDYATASTFRTYGSEAWSDTWTTSNVSRGITDLSSNTMYYYRTYIRNEVGGTSSRAAHLLTLPEFVEDSIGWQEAVATITTVTENSDGTVIRTEEKKPGIQISGRMVQSANGQKITGVTLEYATNDTFTSGRGSYELSSSEFTNTTFSGIITGLTSGATYYARVVISNEYDEGDEEESILTGGDTTSEVFEIKMGDFVEENYVDMDGNSIRDKRAVEADASDKYSWKIEDNEITGYNYVGYRLGGADEELIRSSSLTIDDVSSNPYNQVYYVYDKVSNGLLHVSVPVKMIFSAFESDAGDIYSPDYSIVNHSAFPVDIELLRFEEEEADGLTLVAEEPENEDSFSLYLEETRGSVSVDLGELAADNLTQTVTRLDSGSEGESTLAFQLTGTYRGDFTPVREPQYNAIFRFTAITP